MTVQRFPEEKRLKLVWIGSILLILANSGVGRQEIGSPDPAPGSVCADKGRQDLSAGHLKNNRRNA